MLKIVKSNHLLNLGMVLLILVSSVSCIKDSTEDPLLKYEIALDAFVAKLVANPPDSTDLDRRIKEYLLAQNNDFFGSTVTLLGKDGKATYSPYYYRLNNTLSYKNLLAAGYKIDEQTWLRLPIQKGYAIWTPPFFDEGGGDIWMRTFSVPIYINSVIFAVATTDIEVEKP